MWDRCFGTFKDERPDAPCVYGITTGLKSFNPLWANVHFWIDTWRFAWRTRRWADKIKIWLMPPGWYPADVDPQQTKDWRYPKFDPPVTAFARGYNFVQLWLVTGGSLWLLKAQSQLPVAFVLSAFVWICFSLYVQGAWLEARAYARRLEGLRIAAGAALAVAMQWLWPETLSPFALLVGGYCVASAVAVGVERLFPANHVQVKEA